MHAPEVVLASASPRRRDLLAALGVVARVIAADVDEAARPGEDPHALVTRLAGAKAAAVQAGLEPGAAAVPLVIAADTIVVLGGEVLGKPRDRAEALVHIGRLCGRRHEVLTGHCLLRGDRAERHVERTLVTFRPLDADEIARYVASGEGDDKAGAYAVQGRGVALVERIEGCYSNVVGLSVPTVVRLARSLGVRLG